MMNTAPAAWRKGLGIIALCATAVAASAAWRSAAPVASSVPAAVPPTAVGVVNLKVLFDSLAEFKEGMGLIEEQKESSKVKLKQVEDQLKTAQSNLEMLKDPPIEVRLQHQATIAELQALGEARAATLTRVLEVQAGDIMRRVFLKVEASAKKLAQQDGWDVILIDDRGITPPERAKSQDGKEGRRITIGEVENIIQQRHILVASDRVDVTAALLALMNNEYKAGKK